MKILDKFLNIALILLVGLWLIGHLLKHDKPTLEQQASQAFLDTTIQDARTTEALEHSVANAQKPVLIFVFASWCPYCKKLFPELLALQAEEKDTFRLELVSIDRKPGKLEAYLATQKLPDGIKIYRYGTEEGLNSLLAFMKTHALHYDGGIPYMTIFLDSKPVAELVGSIPKENLRAILKQASTYQKKQLQEFHPENTSKEQE